MLKNGGTRLGVIKNHTLYVECGASGCEHTGDVRVSVLIDRLGESATVAEAIKRLRCTRCKLGLIKEYRLVYEGGSWSALRGAEQGQLALKK